MEARGGLVSSCTFMRKNVILVRRSTVAFSIMEYSINLDFIFATRVLSSLSRLAKDDKIIVKEEVKFSIQPSNQVKVVPNGKSNIVSDFVVNHRKDKFKWAKKFSHERGHKLWL